MQYYSILLFSVLSLSIQPSHSGLETIPNPKMISIEIPCNVLVRSENGETIPINSYDFSTTGADIRQQWAEHVMQGLQPGRSGLQAIRAYAIELNLNGTADVRAEPTTPVQNARHVYPPRFRIPPATVLDLALVEQAQRAEMFAFGSLLYHLCSGHRPFHRLPDTAVEACFATADFPDDTLALDTWPMILSSWSFEFARDLHESISRTSLPRPFFPPPFSHPKSVPAKAPLRARVLTHIRAHPYRSALQASGLLVGAASFSAPLILGAVGFSALGPVAGSAAVAWQSSLGLTQAGSFFALCQSAAMGGAAASGITAVGAVGASVAAGATLVGFVTKDSVGDMPAETVRDMYQKAFRRGPEDDEKSGASRSEL